MCDQINTISTKSSKIVHNFNIQYIFINELYEILKYSK